MSSKTSQLPSLNFEKSFHANGTRFIIGMDEVGRGCIAGEVAVGAVLLDLDSDVIWPSNLKDSKLLSEKAREEIYPELESFGLSWAVGFASVAEIENLGIIQALGLAGSRALEKFLNQANTVKLLSENAVQIILDGNINYLGAKSYGLPVLTKVKADQDCVSVAAASVLAKVTRDRRMVELAQKFQGYGLETNKGYASKAHRDALKELGITEIHRSSWLTKIMAE
jgi:ribonuclease HII